MPGSHLVTDEPRERAEVGVPMAPAEAALLAAGGLRSVYTDRSSSEGGGVGASVLMVVMGRRRADGSGC